MLKSEIEEIKENLNALSEKEQKENTEVKENKDEIKLELDESEIIEIMEVETKPDRSPVRVSYYYL